MTLTYIYASETQNTWANKFENSTEIWLTFRSIFKTIKLLASGQNGWKPPIATLVTSDRQSYHCCCCLDFRSTRPSLYQQNGQFLPLVLKVLSLIEKTNTRIPLRNKLATVHRKTVWGIVGVRPSTGLMTDDFLQLGWVMCMICM